MSDKTCIDILRGSIFVLKSEGEDLFFISPGNRSYVLVPKFEIPSIPYCLVCEFLRPKSLLKDVPYNYSAHRSAHLFIIAISSHSHIKRKQPQIIFLQYSSSVTIFNIVKKIWIEKFMN